MAPCGNAGRHHPLFIASEIGKATDVSPILEDNPITCHTAVGLVDWPTGSLGCMNFAVPCRLKAEAGLARWWGLQLQHEHDAASALSPVSPTAFEERTPNCVSMLALRRRGAEEPASSVNGVICMAYDDRELAAVESFYARFRNASLCRIPLSHFEAVSWQSLPDGGESEWVHCVVCADAAFRPPSYTSPIVQTYLDSVCLAFQQCGGDFLKEFLETTRGWSRYWLDDRRRQLNFGEEASIRFFRIDRSLKTLPSFEGRQNMATYATYKLVPPPLEKAVEDSTVFSGPVEQQKVSYFTFGMGSLINTPSRVGTAGAVAQSAIPVRISASYEFCPCWNFQNRAGGSQLTAGGMVMRSDPRVKRPGAETVGVIYPCPGDDAAMAAQDEREVGYTRYNINLDCVHSLGWQRVPSGITVFQYLPNTELPEGHPQRAKGPDGSPTPRASFPPREYPLSQTYVDTCLLGCLEYSRDFARRWIRGFAGWPSAEAPFWLNDRPLPRRPWVETPQYQIIDEILSQELPDSLPCRLIPSEYGSHYWKVNSGGECACRHVPDMTLDVSYDSYVEFSREETRAKQREPMHFIFEAGLLLTKSFYHGFSNNGYRDSQTARIGGMPCRLGKEAGFRRSFCLRFNGSIKATMCALRSCDADDARDVNGIIYPAPIGWAQESGNPPGGSAAEDKRIWLFDSPQQRLEVDPQHLTVLRSWMIIPPGARVFVYVCTAPSLPSFDFPISQMLVDQILSECLECVGEDFCQEFVDTTDGWLLPDGRAYWLNDRYIARRPWLHLGGQYKIFDRVLLESKSPCIPQGALLKRRLPEEYSALCPFAVASTPSAAEPPSVVPSPTAAGSALQAIKEKRTAAAAASAGGATAEDDES